MRRFHLLLPILLLAVGLSAQHQADASPKPVLLDRATISGVGLNKIRMKADTNRAFFQQRLYRGQSISVYMIASEDYTNPFNPFPFDEFVYLSSGQAVIVPVAGKGTTFSSGDYIIGPLGFVGDWITRANGPHHLELSVIRNQRSKSAKIPSGMVPFRIDVDTQPEDPIIYQGSELIIRQYEEAPEYRDIDRWEVETMIHLLTGTMELQPVGGETIRFFTGDFFIIPQGYRGNLISDGPDVVRYLTVTAVE